MKVERFVFNMFSENCYVLSDETNEAVIIDAGCYFPEEQQQLRGYLIGNKLMNTSKAGIAALIHIVAINSNATKKYQSMSRLRFTGRIGIR